MAILD